MASKEKELWIRIHMNHAHVKDIGLFAILVDSFSRLTKIIKETDRKAETVKQITENSVIKERRTQNDSHKQCVRIWR